MRKVFLTDVLGRRLVALMVTSSALLALIAAGIQLYLSYERDKARALSEFGVVESSFRDGLENALWQFNFAQIELLLDGIFANYDIAYLGLDATTGQSWSRGTQDDETLVLRELMLTHTRPSEEQVAVGTLVVGVSLLNTRRRLWEQFATIAISNFVKTALASLVMLLLFERLVSRHIRSIASQTRSQSWRKTGKPFTLNRSPQARKDIFDNMISALNSARSEVEVAQDRLTRKTRDLEATNERLANANREQAEFTYAISHDLKSPTNTIKMIVELLEQDERERLSPTGREMLDDITRTTTRMGRLVEDVLHYARTVEDTTSHADVQLDVLVQEVLEDLRADISSADAEIVIGTLPHVRGSEVQLRLLFQNLISNAVKFRAPERPPKVEIYSRPAGAGQHAITFSDNGIGIAPEFHDKIFGLFQRLHTHDQYKGSGLGLTLCRRIVFNHGGSIELASEPGQGTVFTVILPAAEGA